jgi:hypothetical protein
VTDRRGNILMGIWPPLRCGPKSAVTGPLPSYRSLPLSSTDRTCRRTPTPSAPIARRLSSPTGGSASGFRLECELAYEEDCLVPDDPHDRRAG